MVKKKIEELGERDVFQVFYLKRKNETVEISEVQEVDVQEIRRHLEFGESVFITSKPCSQIKVNIN